MKRIYSHWQLIMSLQHVEFVKGCSQRQRESATKVRLFGEKQTTKQSVTEELGLMTRKDSPQSPWCSGSKQSSCPLTAACSGRGWKEATTTKKSNQQSTSVFVLKWKLPLVQRVQRKSLNETVGANYFSFAISLLKLKIVSFSILNFVFLILFAKIQTITKGSLFCFKIETKTALLALSFMCFG